MDNLYSKKMVGGECHRTHAIVNCLPLSVRTMLFPFMDNILACYKDGTNGYIL